MLTSSDVLKLLRSRIRHHGSQRAFAHRHRLTQAHVNDVLKRRRRPGPRVLRALGLKRSIVYRYIDGGQ